MAGYFVNKINNMKPGMKFFIGFLCLLSILLIATYSGEDDPRSSAPPPVSPPSNAGTGPPGDTPSEISAPLTIPRDTIFYKYDNIYIQDFDKGEPDDTNREYEYNDERHRYENHNNGWGVTTRDTWSDGDAADSSDSPEQINYFNCANGWANKEIIPISDMMSTEAICYANNEEQCSAVNISAMCSALDGDNPDHVSQCAGFDISMDGCDTTICSYTPAADITTECAAITDDSSNQLCSVNVAGQCEDIHTNECSPNITESECSSIKMDQSDTNSPSVCTFTPPVTPPNEIEEGIIYQKSCSAPSDETPGVTNAICNSIDVSVDGNDCIAAGCELEGYKISTKVQYKVIPGVEGVEGVEGDKLIIDEDGCNIQYAEMDQNLTGYNLNTSIQHYDDSLIIKQRIPDPPNQRGSGYEYGNIGEKVVGIKSKTQCIRGYSHGLCQALTTDATDTCSSENRQNNRPLCESDGLCEYIPSYDNYSLYQDISMGIPPSDPGIPIEIVGSTFKLKDGPDADPAPDAGPVPLEDQMNHGTCINNIYGEDDCSLMTTQSSCLSQKVGAPSPPQVDALDGPRSEAISLRITFENHTAAFEGFQQQLRVFGFDPDTPEGLVVIQELSLGDPQDAMASQSDRNNIIAAQNYYDQEEAVRESEVVAASAEAALPDLGPLGYATEQLFRAAHNIQAPVTQLVAAAPLEEIVWPSELEDGTSQINKCSWISHKELDLDLPDNYCSNDCYVNKGDEGTPEEKLNMEKDLIPFLDDNSIVLNRENAVNWGMKNKNLLRLYEDPLCNNINENEPVCLNQEIVENDESNCVLEPGPPESCSVVPSQMGTGLTCSYVAVADGAGTCTSTRYNIDPSCSLNVNGGCDGDAATCQYFDNFSCDAFPDSLGKRFSIKTNDNSNNSNISDLCGGAWSGNTRNLICSDGEYGIDCDATNWPQDRVGSQVVEGENEGYTRYSYSNYSYITPSTSTGVCIRRGTDMTTDCEIHTDRGDCESAGCLYEENVFLSSIKNTGEVLTDANQICSGGGNTFDIYSECEPNTCSEMLGEFACNQGDGFIPNPLAEDVRPPIERVLINSAASEGDKIRLLNDIITETCCTPITCANNSGGDGGMAGPDANPETCISLCPTEVPVDGVCAGNCVYVPEDEVTQESCRAPDDDECVINPDSVDARRGCPNTCDYTPAGGGSQGFSCSGTNPGEQPDPYVDVMYYLRFKIYIEIQGILNENKPIDDAGNGTNGDKYYEIFDNREQFKTQMINAGKYACAAAKGSTDISSIANDSIQIGRIKYEPDPISSYYKPYVYVTIKDKKHSQIFREARISPTDPDPLFPIPRLGTHIADSDDLAPNYKYDHSFMRGIELLPPAQMPSHSNTLGLLLRQDYTNMPILQINKVEGDGNSNIPSQNGLPGQSSSQINILIIEEKAKYMGIECATGTCNYSTCCDIHTCQSYDQLYQDNQPSSTICPLPTTSKYPVGTDQPGPYVVNLLCLNGTHIIHLENVQITLTKTDATAPEDTPSRKMLELKNILRLTLIPTIQGILSDPNSNDNRIFISFGNNPDTGEWDGISDDALGIKVTKHGSSSDFTPPQIYDISIYINSYKINSTSYQRISEQMAVVDWPTPITPVSSGYSIEWNRDDANFGTRVNAAQQNEWNGAECIEYTHYKTASETATRMGGASQDLSELGVITNELSDSTCCEIQTCGNIEIDGIGSSTQDRTEYCSTQGEELGGKKYQSHATFIGDSTPENFSNVCCLDNVIAYLPLAINDWSEENAANPDLYQYGSYIWDPREDTVEVAKGSRINNAMMRFGNINSPAGSDPMVRGAGEADDRPTDSVAYPEEGNIDIWDTFPGRLDLTDVEFDDTLDHYVHSQHYDTCPGQPNSTCGSVGGYQDNRNDRQKIFDRFIEQVKCDNSDTLNPVGTPTGHIGQRSESSIREPSDPDGTGQEYPTLGITPLDISSYTDDNTTGLYNSMKYALSYDYNGDDVCTPDDRASEAQILNCAEHNHGGGRLGCVSSNNCNWVPDNNGDGTTPIQSKMDLIDSAATAAEKYGNDINFYYLNGCLSMEELMCRVPSLRERDIARYDLNLSNVHGIAGLISAGELSRDIAHATSYGAACGNSISNNFTSEDSDPYQDLSRYHFAPQPLPPGENRAQLNQCDNQFGDIKVSGCGSVNKTPGSLNTANPAKNKSAYIQEPKVGEVLCGDGGGGACQATYGGTCTEGTTTSMTECLVECDYLIPKSRSQGLSYEEGKIHERNNTAVQTWCTNRYDSKILNVDRHSGDERCNIDNYAGQDADWNPTEAHKKAICDNLANCQWSRDTGCQVKPGDEEVINQQLCENNHFFRAARASESDNPCNSIPNPSEVNCEYSGICMFDASQGMCVTRTPAPGDTNSPMRPDENEFTYDKCIPCTESRDIDNGVILWPSDSVNTIPGENKKNNIFKTAKCGEADRRHDLVDDDKFEFNDSKHAYCLDRDAENLNTGLQQTTNFNDQSDSAAPPDGVRGENTEQRLGWNPNDSPKLRDYLNKYIKCDNLGNNSKFHLESDKSFFHRNHQRDDAQKPDDISDGNPNYGQCLSNDCTDNQGDCIEKNAACSNYIDQVDPAIGAAAVSDASKKLLCETHENLQCYWKDGYTNAAGDNEKKNWKMLRDDPTYVDDGETMNLFGNDISLNEKKYNAYFKNIAILNSINSRRQVCNDNPSEQGNDAIGSERQRQLGLYAFETGSVANTNEGQTTIDNQYAPGASTSMCIPVGAGNEGGVLETTEGGGMSYPPLISARIPQNIDPVNHPLTTVLSNNITNDNIQDFMNSYDEVTYKDVFRNKVLDAIIPGAEQTIGQLSNKLSGLSPGEQLNDPTENEGPDICKADHFLMMGLEPDTMECVRCGQPGSVLEGYYTDGAGKCRRTFCQCDVHGNDDDDDHKYKMVQQTDPAAGLQSGLGGNAVYQGGRSLRGVREQWNPGANCGNALRILSNYRANSNSQNIDRLRVCDAQEQYLGHGGSGGSRTDSQQGQTEPQYKLYKNSKDQNIYNTFTGPGNWVFDSSVCRYTGAENHRYSNEAQENEELMCHTRGSTSPENCFQGLGAEDVPGFVGDHPYVVELCQPEFVYTGYTGTNARRVTGGNLQKKCSGAQSRADSDCGIDDNRAGMRCDVGYNSQTYAGATTNQQSTTPSTLAQAQRYNSTASTKKSGTGMSAAYIREGTCTISASIGGGGDPTPAAYDCEACASPGGICSVSRDDEDVRNPDQSNNKPGNQICGHGNRCQYYYEVRETSNYVHNYCTP